MKEIELNNLDSASYLRGDVISAEIDESDLEFRLGLAVVKAKVMASYFCTEKITFECMGLINEKYEEAFQDKINLFERNLMFMPFNKSIIRCGDNDFIVEVSCKEDNRTWTEFRHIKIIDRIPTLISRNLGGCQKTSLESVVIAGFNKKYLYNVDSNKVVTPSLIKIQESNEQGIFDAVAKVQLNTPYYIDHLFFKINSEGMIVSSILSSLENGFLSESYNSISDLLAKREENLGMVINSFDSTLTSFENSKVSELLFKGETRKRIPPINQDSNSN